MRDLNFDIKGRDRTQPAFDSARRNARGLNAEMDQTRVVMNAAGSAARAFAGAFALTSVAGFAATIRSTVAEAARLANVADMIGVNVEALQQLRYGFETMGVAADQTDTALRRFARRVGEAANGGGVLHGVLTANNVALRDADGRMRSQVDILRDYAELIKNAGSHQERLALGFKAFDVAGASMVTALSDGAAGLDRLMSKAEEAGGVLNEEIVRRAAEIDTEFGKVWRQFEITAKSAILEVSVALRDGLLKDIGDIGSAMRDLWNNPSMTNLDRVLFGERGPSDSYSSTFGAMAHQLETQIEGLKQTRDLWQGQGIDIQEVETNIRSLQQELDKLYRNAGPNNMSVQPRLVAPPPTNQVPPATPTIIPGGRGENDGRSRQRATAAAREQVSAYDQVIERLQLELQMIGLSAIEQRVLTEQRRAGVDATGEQGRAIDEIIRQIEREKKALEELEAQQRAVNDAIAYMAGSALDTFFSWAEGAATAEEAAIKLGKEILRLVAYAALLGQGPLAGLFGGGWSGGGGLIGMLLGGPVGARAGGGPVDPWGTYVVGENGPEVLRMGGRGGHVTSNRDAFGGSGGGAPVNVTVNIQTQDAQSFARNRGHLEATLARAVMRGQRGL